MILEFVQKDSLEWRLEQIYDPYNGGTTYQSDSLNPSFLSLNRKGKFAEYDTLNRREGKWYFHEDSTRIRLAYTQENGTKIIRSERDPDFRYVLKTLTEDSLVLAIQGRHGMVERIYIRTKPAIQDSLSVDTMAVPPPKDRALPPAALPLAKATQLVLPDSTQDTIVWKLREIYDPYVETLPKGERTSPRGEKAFPDNPHFLVFCRNGDFIEKDSLNYATGKWYLNSTEDRLRLSYTERNGQVILNETSLLFRWEIQRMANDSLVLGIQGRHGIVTHTYTKVNSGDN